MNKAVLITGATKGMGREICLAFARAGYVVIGTYKSDSAAAEQLRSELQADGATFNIIQTDAAEPSEELWKLPEIVNATSLVLINNACPGFNPEPMHRVLWSEVGKQLDIGLKGAWLASQALIPRMVRSKSGTIVNVLTTAVEGLPPKGFSAYVIGKHALRGMTLALAAEFASRGVRVFSVSPGFMDTSFTKAWDSRLRDAIASSDGRSSVPSDAAQRILQLVESSEIPANGEDHPI
jgi:3-oxoacyl-[acyl-carrier protein] reductase